MGIPDEQITSVIEIARHMRDEVAQKLDAAFDAKANVELPAVQATPKTTNSMPQLNVEVGDSCCSSTPSGQSCC